ncbi:hypothetical protein BC830DRAFT_690663 [Chytriomyces sp. MP71]|nr:hypothetical protein BC830DRAFT_690663 [Chytriomyces sp. MP71]
MCGNKTNQSQAQTHLAQCCAATSAEDSLLALLCDPALGSASGCHASCVSASAVKPASPSPSLSLEMHSPAFTTSPDWPAVDSFDGDWRVFRHPQNQITNAIPLRTGTSSFTQFSLTHHPDFISSLSLFNSLSDGDALPLGTNFQVPTNGLDFFKMSSFGIPSPATTNVAVASSNPRSAPASSNVASPAVDGALAEILFSPSPSSFTSFSPNEFSFGTPFAPAMMDAASASSFSSVDASSSVFSSTAGNGSPAGVDALNWLNSLAAQTTIQALNPSASSKTSPSLGKGNRVTGVSSVYDCRVAGTKQTVEQPAFCNVCASPIATMVLRGSLDAFDAGYLVDITCDSCQTRASPVSPRGTPGSDTLSLKFVQSRKRARKVNEGGKAVHCDVCQTHVGSGGVQVFDDTSAKRACSNLNTAPSKSRKSAFSVEVVCAPCRDSYGFCTECGGGGKYRTGKYRPFALFADGRRTCSLPHFRLGDTKARHSFAAATPHSLAEAKVLFMDAFVSAHATPKMMASPAAPYRTLDAIHAAALSAWSKEESRVWSASVPQYISFAAIPKSSRKKARSNVSVSAEDVHMAFLTAEHAHGVLVIKQLASKVSATAQNASLVLEMVRAAVAALPAGSVQHVLVSSTVLAPGHCEKLGVVAVDTYLGKVPADSAALYVRQRAVEEMFIREGEVFVVGAGALF